MTTPRRLLPSHAGARAAGRPRPAHRAETAPPPPGPPRTLRVPVTSEHVLSNGLRVIAVRRAQLPLATIRFALRSGSEADPPTLPGAASLAADLLTRGTPQRSATAIAEAAASLGGSIDAAAGWCRTDVTMTVTTPRLESAAALLADVIRNPAFAGDEVERARKQALDALRVAWSEPAELAELVARRLVFGAGCYGHPAAGTLRSLKALTREDLASLHRIGYRPDNAVLVFAGDVEPSHVFALAERTFGDWRKPGIALPGMRVSEPETAGGTAVAVDLPGTGQACVVAAQPAIGRDSPDYYAGIVANAVLGGSYSSRLNAEIRIKRGLSYGATSGLEALRSGGWLFASTQTRNPSANEVATLSLDALDSLRTTPPSAAELEARKATLCGHFGRSLETTAGLAAQVVERAVHGIDLDDIGRHGERVQAVTPADVQRFAEVHLDPAAVRVVIAGDARRFGASLRKRWPAVATIEAKALDQWVTRTRSRRRT